MLFYSQTRNVVKRSTAARSGFVMSSGALVDSGGEGAYDSITEALTAQEPLIYACGSFTENIDIDYSCTIYLCNGFVLTGTVSVDSAVADGVKIEALGEASISGLIDWDANAGCVQGRNQLTCNGGVDVDAATWFLNGGGLGAVIDSPTVDRDALNVNGDDSTITNLLVKKTSTGHSSSNIENYGSRHVVSFFLITGSDNNDQQSAGVDHIIVGHSVTGSSNWINPASTAHRAIYSAFYRATTLGFNIYTDDGIISSSVIDIGSLIGTYQATAEDNLLYGNRCSASPSDLGTGLLNAANNTTAF